MKVVHPSRSAVKRPLLILLVLALLASTMIPALAESDKVYRLAGDFNGDGVTTPGWFADGLFVLYGATDGGDIVRFRYGRPGDVPVVGDWTGDNRDTVGVVRHGRRWLLRDSNTAGDADRAFVYGGWLGRDRPVVGDWTGKGYDAPGVVRGSSWHLRTTLSAGNADITFKYGRIGDIPVVGDWSNKGRDTVGVVRDGVWHIRSSNGEGHADWVLNYGRDDDLPVVGNWDGRGGDTPGVVRETTWMLKNVLSGGSADVTLDLADPALQALTAPEIVATRKPTTKPIPGALGKPSPEPERKPDPEFEPAPESKQEPASSIHGGETAGGLTRTSIGSPQPTGQLSERDGTYTLSGAGADIWKSSDSFEFAHRPLEGDGSLVVRVTSQTDTHEWAKAGIMIRGDESPGAQHVSLFQTPRNGVAFQYRPTAAGATSHLAGPSSATPSWLRLDREGDTFKGYSSNDGLTWTLIGSVAVAMATVAIAGLAVTSQDDGTLSSAQFDSFQQLGLESVEAVSPAPNATSAETSPAPDVSAGLLHTPEEVAIWRQRAVSGPYRVDGDVSANSPGDWTRIRRGADQFLANPESSRWNGPSQGNLSTCVQKWDDEPPVGRASNLRDAAFVALVTGEAAEREAVKRELLSQASVPGTDFSNASRWCAGVLYDINPSFQISHWVTKLLLAYDYLGRASFTESEQEKLDRWFLYAARFIQTDLDLALGRIYVDRGNSDQLTWSTINSPSCNQSHYLDGPESCSLHRRYNNRHAANARLVGLVGVFLEDETLKRSARLFVEEYVKYGVFPEGFVSDFERWSTRQPELGWAYGANALAPVLIIADAFARAGDSSLYDYSTSVGALGTEGGPKDLLFAARSFGKHVDGSYRRYGTDDPNKRGDRDYLIDGKFESGNWYGVHDISFAQANIYYRDTYLKGAYTRSSPGMGGYPLRASGGPYVIWTGEGGILPGVLFMYGQMEEKVWPYG